MVGGVPRLLGGVDPGGVRLPRRRPGVLPPDRGRLAGPQYLVLSASPPTTSSPSSPPDEWATRRRSTGCGSSTPRRETVCAPREDAGWFADQTLLLAPRPRLAAMPRMHALELLPDDAGVDVVRRDWQALRDAGLPSQLDHRGATNTPHLTAVAAPALGPADEERAVELVGAAAAGGGAHVRDRAARRRTRLARPARRGARRPRPGSARPAAPRGRTCSTAGGCRT